VKGSIEERIGKNGSAWRLRVHNGSDPSTGKPVVIRKTIPASAHLKKRDVQRELRNLIAEIEDGTYVEPTADTVGDMLDRWIASVEASASVRPKSLENYKLICSSYIRPYLGAVPITGVSPSHIDRAYQELRGRDSKRGGKISPRTVSHAHRTLSEAFKWAVSRGLVVANPCDRVKPPKAERPEIRVIEPTEWTLLLEYLEEHSEWAIVPTVLALTTGARRSEILGLNWADVQLDTGQMSIQRALSQLRDQSVLIQPTKTPKSTRQVALADVAISSLRRWKSKQEKRAEMAGLTVHLSDPVFSDPPVDGDATTWKPYLPSSLSQAFSRACKHLSLTGASFKSLRHTHASTLLRANVHPKVVQERLGHSTITTTLDVYSHVTPGLQEAAAKAFDNAFTDTAIPLAGN